VYLILSFVGPLVYESPLSFLRPRVNATHFGLQPLYIFAQKLVLVRLPLKKTHRNFSLLYNTLCGN
jgi:hypothetical protein